MRYLDPVVLAKLKNLRFDLGRHISEGHLAGRHRSSRRGFSQEFAEHRAYVAGDEIKRLDWKVYARKDRFYIKEFQEEKSLKTYLLVDASGSMAYRGSGPESKWELGSRLAMCMGYLVLAQGDSAGMVTFDTATRRFLPPRQRLSHIELMDEVLAQTTPGGETDLAGVLRRIVASLPRRSLIILVSDLLGDAHSLLETMRAFRARKHRVFILQVLDRRERDLDLEGPVLFEALEGRGELRCEVGLLRDSYREAFERQQRLYTASFHRSGIHFATFYTDAPWEQGLAHFLARQSASG
ncbi:MAG: hypothetical protein A2X36_07785 [Elusimicrobia bacterium GWA2_69_24]|nr:MAG: hypothetical protein A2X36_07785 [Elusimicrobia bacterium GWA2_69_24]HBL16027.1 DUF58 domain-containing protein [Elusimicrobiota bacterium]